jgi:uncharacterized protein with NAD-binding domain and iron-sulfur cluster
MTDSQAAGGGPEKIAILGGGIGALVTAFELTSQPGWQDRFDITLHQIGWRLGGKCASSRGVHGRIEEHGIHAFLGSYYNALPMMAACYAELGRAPGEPLATFEAAFLPESFVLMWEWREPALQKWPMTFPRNAIAPTDATAFVATEKILGGVLETLSNIFGSHKPDLSIESGLIGQGAHLVARAGQALAATPIAGVAHPILDIIGDAWKLLTDLILKLIESNDELRRLFILADLVFAMIRGVVADDLVAKGWDSIDDQNWSDWLLAHGAHPITVSSPMALNTINMTYQYPTGDTSLSPRMVAGAYVHWTLRSFAYMGAMIYLFAAGTGETLIAPLYLVLKKRGVKFSFFHKVEALRLSDDKTSVSAVEMSVQANLKDPGAAYDPLIAVKGLPCWPASPRFEQLVEGAALQSGNIDLESYWTPWRSPGRLTLQAGVDYDRLVFAISIGAVPYLCADLMAASPAWRDMVDAIKVVRTQQLQIWLNKDLYELGWDIPLAEGDTVVSATYLNPGDGQAEFSHLVQYEDWPPGQEPKSLWYFCGLMSSYGPPPPFTDPTWPNYQWNRVRFQSIQYLQAGMGPLLPKATTNAQNPPGDPVGFDFGLLVDALPSVEADGAANVGIARIESQFWRANIDPTEHYVTSPPGSTQYRLKAWDTGFSNLVVAGDWIYTGINIGSVEGTVMSGKLASYALSGAPALETIIGYPAPKT